MAEQKTPEVDPQGWYPPTWVVWVAIMAAAILVALAPHFHLG